MYKYSIIIPVYNAENTIRRAIDCIVRQTYKNWELILINDGSTDESRVIIEEYSQKDKRIIMINQENSGPGISRNNGIRIASGDYVTFLDSDDYFDIDYLESVEKINSQEKKDVIFVDFIEEDTEGNDRGQSSIYSCRDLPKYNLLCLQMTGVLPWGPVVKAVSKSIIKTCSFSELEVGEEAIYSFDVLNKSEKIGFIESPKYHYVHNEKGQHKKGGLDPWGPVVKALSNHLIECDYYNEFKSNINSFALRALCINVYRCSCSFDKKAATKSIADAYDRYKSEYDFKNINKKSIDKKSLIISICLKMHMYWLVYYASKMRRGKS